MAVNDKLHSIDHILPWLGAKSFVMIPVNSVAKDSQITFVAFLRGINVGGNKLIKMTELKQAFESLGFREVQTLIASGNVVFCAASAKADVLLQKIEQKLKKTFGHDIPVIMRTLGQLRKLAAANPFKGVKITPETRLNVSFLADKARSDLKIPYATPKEDFCILKVSGGEVFSVVDLSKGGSTLDAMSFIEKEFGRNTTTRNWNTINRILEATLPAPAASDANSRTRCRSGEA